MSEYTVTLVGGPASPVHLQSPPRPELIAGPPPQFGGSDVWWSPEHLLVAALASCFDATFRGLAARAGVPLRGFSCRARAVVDKTPNGLAMSGFHLAIDVEVATSDASRAHALLGEAERRCIVRNALKGPVIVEPIVTLAAASHNTSHLV